jgi:hypothetical protein
MKSKHGTASNLEEFARFLVDDLKNSSESKTKNEIVIGRFKDYVANKLGPLTLSDDEKLADTVQMIYKMLLGDK